jgi:hypothetical protein
MSVLRTALNHMNMNELKGACQMLGIIPAGKKGDIIRGISSFVRNGKKPTAQTIPRNCRTHPKGVFPLKPQTPIPFGSFKNNDVTREFLKSLVGQHFHFTAFGQYWIRNRWMKGKPPTYAEFARAWQKEYLRRRALQTARPKKEWAYLNFVQRFVKKSPTTSLNELANEWKKLRASQAALAKQILGAFKRSGKSPRS